MLTATQMVKSWLIALTRAEDSSRSILPFIPRPIKWFFLLLVLLNWRGFPLLWHLRVWRHVFEIRGKGLMYSRAPSGRRQFITDVSMIGADPLSAVITSSGRAGIADCDYNGHLSNSAFAKNLDPSCLKFFLKLWPAFFVDKSWVALGGSHYIFIREIPFQSPYEIRLSVGAWDDKWVYIIGQFVTYPSAKQWKKINAKAKAKESKPNANGHTSPPDPSPNLLSLPTISTAASGTTTPQEEAHLSPSSSQSLTKAHLVPIPSNALLHSITISTYCFKHGRITVPPRIAMVMSGLGSKGKERWDRLMEIRAKGKMGSVLSGAWRDEFKEEGDFWEMEECEERRRANLEVLRMLRDGMEGLKP